MSSIGMMDGAFFVGRREIVDWVNATLHLNLEKIEDTASGAVACQLLDIMHPNTVPMAKLHWSAAKDFEFVANYKILQTCFTKLHIDKVSGRAACIFLAYPCAAYRRGPPNQGQVSRQSRVYAVVQTIF